ncbi:MAG: hypothetical protein LC676_10905 [Loktanella sp.]|nr:hypothetical protein [Loktanella sp.]
MITITTRAIQTAWERWRDAFRAADPLALGEHQHDPEAVAWANREVRLIDEIAAAARQPGPRIAGEKSIRFWYVNWRGETSIRTAIPVIIRFGSTVWHPRPQWILTAFDVDKREQRDFALEDCQFIAQAEYET